MTSSPVVLPAELELSIFETCIATSPATASTLLCVAKYIHDWLIPSVYKIVVVFVKNDIREPSIDAIKKYGSHIRHLLFGWLGSEEVLTEYLTWSPNIINLVIWNRVKDDGNWKDVAQRLPLIRLSIHPYCLYSDTQSDESIKETLFNFLSNFPHLTHLDFASTIPGRFLEFLPVLPNLTFLSLYEEGDSEDVDEEYPDLRDAQPSIKCIIFFDERSFAEDYETHENQSGRAHDPRSIGCIVPNYVEDWRKGARGEPDVGDFVMRVTGGLYVDLK